MLTAKRRYGFVLGIVVLFLGLRLVKLQEIPLFVDEALHLSWALEFWQGQFSGPIPDGKFLYFFLLTPALWFAQTILLARIISILISLVALGLLYVSGRRLFDEPTALLACLIYALSPLLVLHDPMIMQEGLLALFGLATLLMGLRFARQPTLRNGALFNLVLALALVGKLPGLYFLVMPPLSYMISQRRAPLRDYCRSFLLFGWMPLETLIVLVMAGWGRGQGEKLFSHDISYLKHLQLAFSWFACYLTWPLLAVYLFSAVAATVLRRYAVLWLFCLSLVPLLLYPLVVRWLFPRYFIFVLPFAFLCMAWGIRHFLLDQKKLRFLLGAACLVGMLIPSVITDYQLWRTWETNRIPGRDRRQYGTQWAAGYGFQEAASFLQTVNSGPYRIAANFTAMHRLRWLVHDTHAEVDWVNTQDPEAIERLSPDRGRPVFLVFNDPLIRVHGLDLEKLEQRAVLIKEFPKPLGRSRVLVYRLKE